MKRAGLSFIVCRDAKFYRSIFKQKNCKFVSIATVPVRLIIKPAQVLPLKDIYSTELSAAKSIAVPVSL
ncbi:MAG: hypothetical protein KME19_12365 [Microcoleus vaginatus WJT46-NPBG5]|jgi:hypothetical protein|nr:hypothetical protein [Microcoleus vaginatus WJT46-NPBG5]